MAALLASPLASANPYETEAKPLWEAGVAAGFASLPQYMGSNERYAIPLAFPYIVYRGKILKADREGLRGRLFDSERLTLDLDFGFGLPVRNKNAARQGMPKVKMVGQVGPQLNWYWRREVDNRIVTHLPLRAAFDIDSRYVGWVAEPSLHLQAEAFGPGKDWSGSIELGALIGSRQYNDYYYGVAPAYATAARPAYAARSGLHSLFVDSSLNHRFTPDFKAGLFLRLRTLAPGVVADSPLVKQKGYAAVGLGMVWRLHQSERSVQAEE